MTKKNIPTQCCITSCQVQIIMRFLIIKMVVALLVLTGLQACNIGNSSSITEIKFNDLYLEILNEVEALYELKDDD